MRVLASGIAVVIGGLLATSTAWAGQAMPAEGPAVSGFGEFGYGYAGNNDHYLYDTDTVNHAGALDAAAIANLRFSSGLNFEIEGRYYDVSNGPDGDLSSLIAGYGHFFGRSSAGAAGIFGGHGFIDGADMWTAGGEAVANIGNVDFLAQAAYFNFRSRYYNPDGWFARGAVRMFLGMDTRLQADVQVNDIHTDGLGFKSLTVVGTAEHHFAGQPVSAFASVRWDHINPDYGSAGDEVTASLGIRAYFGSASPMANYREGAPFDVIPLRLADVTR